MNQISTQKIILKYLGWAVVSFSVFFQFLIQTTSSLMQAGWMHYFHLSTLSVSYLSAAFFYTYLFFQIPVGVIYDRFNARMVLTISLLFLAIGCASFALTSSYHLAILFRMIMGAGAAFGFIGMLKVTANFFPGRKFSLMIGFSDAFAAIGTVIGVIILAHVLVHSTWQIVMKYCAWIVLTVTLLAFMFIRTKKPENTGVFNIKNLFKNILKACTNSVVLITGVYGFFIFSVVNAFSSLWGVSFLTTAYPITNEYAAKVMSMIFLGLAFGCPISGYLSKRFANEIKTMKICAVVCGLTMFLIIDIRVPVETLGILFFIVGLVSAAYIQCFAIVGQTVSSDVQATSMSVTNMLIMLSAPALQILIGAILHVQSFGFAHSALQNDQIALSVLPFGMLIAFALCFLLRRKA